MTDEERKEMIQEIIRLFQIWFDWQETKHSHEPALIEIPIIETEFPQ